MGFQVHSRRTDSINASYIEKREYIEEVTDPFDNKIEFQRIEYQQTQFLIKKESPNIIIYNPSRYYRKLLNKIAQLTEYNLVIEDKSVDLFQWVKEISKDGVAGKVSKMKVERIKYDSKTTGSLTLSSETDLRPKIVKILGSKSYSLKKVTIIYDKNPDLPRMDLFSNGRIVFSRPVDYTDFDKIYQAFNKIVLSKK
jgi:hypothetical protein